MRKIAGDFGPIFAIGFYSYGQKLWAAGFNGAMRIWEYPAGTLLRVFFVDRHNIYDPVFEAVDPVLLGRVCVHARNNFGGEFPWIVRHSYTSPDARFLIAESDGLPFVYQNPPVKMGVMARSRDGMRVAKYTEGQLLAEKFWKCDARQEGRGIVFHPNGEQIAIAGSRSVQLSPWNHPEEPERNFLQRRTDRDRLRPTRHEMPYVWRAEGMCPRSLSFSPDGRYLAAACVSGELAILHSESGECLWRINPGLGMLFTVAFAPDGLTIVCAGQERGIMLLDID